MITILADIGNKGFALPMVQAYPLDVNSQYLLAWNPIEQALDYIPYVGNSLGDFGITRDLSVGRNAAVTGNATVGGTLAVTGASTLTGNATVTGSLIANGGIAPADGSLEITGAVAVSSSVQAGVAGTGPMLDATTNTVRVGGSSVVSTRKAGWTAATGTATRTTFVTTTVTLPQLAEHVKALIDDLIQGTGHGLIGN